jgi:hypothetical protein
MPDQDQNSVQSPPVAEKNSLGKFLEENQRLITVLGVFTALTVFTTNLPLKPIGYLLSFVFLALSLIVWIELLERFPRGEATWKLRVFESLLAYSFMGIFLYWLLAYRELWEKAMPFALAIIISIILTNVVTYPIRKYDVFDRLLGTKSRVLKFVRHALFWIIIVSVLFVSLLIGFVIAPIINHALDNLYNDAIKMFPGQAPS